MDEDCSPMFFERIRKQLIAIPPDDLKRMDKFHMREFALEALKVCEAQAHQLGGDDPELYPVHTATLQLRLEKFSGPTA